MPKISELPAADTLTGAELVPIVQDGATVQTTAEALAGLGGVGEVLLATVSNFDLAESGIWRALYIVPTGKKLLPTKVIFAEPTQLMSFGAVDNITVRDSGASFTALVVVDEFPDTDGMCIVRIGKQGRVIPQGAALQARVNTGYGSAATCTVYVFGMLLDA